MGNPCAISFFIYCSYAVLPEWYVHDESTEAMETNENDLSHALKKRPMLGHDSMTVWQRLVFFDRECLS